MDMHVDQPFGGLVDLDEESTYEHYDWKDYSFSNLCHEFHAKIGYCKIYTECWYKDWDKRQCARIDDLASQYASERNQNWNNRIWIRKLLWHLVNETENMC